MENIVISRNPSLDREAATHGHPVVLFHDQTEIVLLTQETDGRFYIQGHQSVYSAEGEEIQESDFYFDHIGYMDESFICYGCLESKKSSEWDDAYDFVRNEHGCGCGQTVKSLKSA